MSATNNRPQEPQRPVSHRLLHAFGETVLGLAFGGASFLAIWELVCYRSTRCEDFKGLAYMIFSFVAAMMICAAYFSLCRRLRHRLKARYRFDAIVAVLTVAFWIFYLI